MWWLIRIWLPLALAVSGICVVVYIASQQSYRQSVNDPQIQFANDAADRVLSGDAPESAVPDERVLITRSLAPFIAVYDASGKPLASSGYIGEDIPVPPLEIFARAAATGEYRFTWEPVPGTEIATVVVSIAGERGFALSGRNMKEQEERIWKMFNTIALSWFLILLVTLFASWLGARAIANP